MKIYIASSFKNLHAVHSLSILLEDRGHTVLDWSKFAPPLSPKLTPEQRKIALDATERDDIFEFCSESCAHADLVIYLGPAGQDAACEIGMAYVAGVHTFGLAGPLEVPGLILNKAVSKWCRNVDHLLDKVFQHTMKTIN